MTVDEDVGVQEVARSRREAATGASISLSVVVDIVISITD